MTSDQDPAAGVPAWGPRPSTPWWRRPQRLIAALAAGVLVAGLLAAAVIAFVAFHSSGDRLTALTPDDTDLYATMLLDPSVGQKLHIAALAHKFPTLQSGDPNKQLDSTLQDAFKGTGLSFRNDVRPWLGHQVSIAARTKGSLDSAPALAILADAGDEGRAGAALDKFRASSAGREYDWKRTNHNGVTVWTGNRRDTSGSSSSLDNLSAYAVLDHMAVVASDAGYLNEVIDTAQGRHGNLAASTAYRQTMGRLPSDYVVSGYVDARPIVRSLRTSFSGLSAPGGSGPDPTKSLEAFRAAGITLAAGDNEVSADVDIELDRSKLDATGRAAQDLPAHRNTTLSSVPPDALGFIGVSGVKQSAQALLKQYGPDPQAHDLLQQLGLDGPGGIVDHLSGDLGLEVGPGARSIPAGALLIGVDDPAVAHAFLDKLAALALAGGPGGSGTASGDPSLASAPIKAADPAAASPPPAENYHGVSVTSLGPGDGGFAPSYAVVGKVAVIASSRAAVHAVIDAAGRRQSLATAPAYTSALAGRASNNGEAFLDFDAITRAIRNSMGDRDSAKFDSDVAPKLRPLHTLVYTTVNHSDHVSGRISLRLH